MTFYINEKENILLELASDGSEDSFLTDGYELADDAQVIAFRAAQDAANEPTPEQLLALANAQRDSLLAIAALRIAPLQDAVDIEVATAADIALLKKWKQYRIAVNHVPEQPEYPKTISWPTSPDA